MLEQKTVLQAPSSVPSELVPHFLFNSSFAGKIKPQSVNSMYFFDNKTAQLKKSSAAEAYEKQIKHLIEQKMSSKKIRQIKTPVLLDIIFEIELEENKDGSISGRWRLDLDNLMKASIDSISKTIINDDILVYWLHARINYKRKTRESFLNPANAIRFFIYEYNDETREYFKWLVEKHSFQVSTHSSFSWEEGIVIPSYNLMYFIKNGKRVLSPVAESYKAKLKKDIEDAHPYLESDKRYYAVYGNFGAYNYAERDVDNMLKATFDAFTGTVYKDDKQILEFFVEKRKVESAGDVRLSFYHIDDEIDYLWED